MTRVKHSTINIIMGVRLALGYFSEFSNGVIFNVTAKVYCILFVVFCSYINYYMLVGYKLPIRLMITAIHKMVFFILTTIVSLLSNGEYFYRYLASLDELESHCCMRRKGESNISLFILTLTVSSNICSYLYLLFEEPYDNKTKLVLFMACMLFTGTALNHLARILIFELMWNRMKSLRLLMEKYLDFSEPALRTDQIELKVTKMEDYLKVYCKLLDNLKFAGHASKLLIMLSLPWYFIYIVSFSMEFLKNGSIQISIGYIIDAVLNISLPLVPALLAEFVTVEVEKVKLHLKRQLFVCPHDALRNRTYDALKILELRPFKYTIWRAFSLNISLPLGLISLCTTYTIVVIQFSHVYS